MSTWLKTTWKKFPCRQLDFYPFGSRLLKEIISCIKGMGGVAKVDEIITLKQKIANFCKDKSFILQAGNCAESFSESHYKYTKSQVIMINALAKYMEVELGISIIPIGRIAGQYGKPRSSKYSSDDIINYHGDIINSLSNEPSARNPNEYRLLLAYAYSKKIRSYMDELRQSEVELNHFIYTSHEAFFLPYEEAMTREHEGRWYDCSAHFLWVGYRSLYENSPHLEFVRGIENPIGLKIGPKISTDCLVKFIHQVNPNNELGKIILIFRLGTDYVEELLPRYIECIQREGLNLLWMNDLMHGNTQMISNRKVRFLTDIREELLKTLKIHKKYNIPLSGIHIESTGYDVFECADDKSKIEKLLNTPYTSLMDPRLNTKQALDILSTYVNQMYLEKEKQVGELYV